MTKGPSWAPSSGLNVLAGIGQPSVVDLINQAEEQAELDRLAAELGNSHTQIQTNLPKAYIPGVSFFVNKKIKKIK